MLQSIRGTDSVPRRIPLTRGRFDLQSLSPRNAQGAVARPMRSLPRRANVRRSAHRRRHRVRKRHVNRTRRQSPMPKLHSRILLPRPRIPSATMSSGNAFGATSCQPQACDPGHYSRLGDHLCTECPARGKSVSVSVRRSDRVRVPRGSIRQRGRGYVHLVCANPALAPVVCSLGQYSLGNQSSCIDCPPGFQCVSPSSPPFECSPGFYSLGRATNCTEFLAGSACVSNAEAPTPCDPGHYSNAGMTACPS